MTDIRVKTSKFCIDYLDHTVSTDYNYNESANRLRFDLLLFSENILCMSVPACVKIDSTTNLLMQLTPFWKAGKIKLILDNKHRNNPKNYFNNRKRVLERGFTEQELINHFEYRAYTSAHTDYFYNTYIAQIANISSRDLYLDKVFDTDETFRRSVITQIERNADSICSKLPVADGIHMAKIFNELLIISEDRRTLFQRLAVENRLTNEYGATPSEITHVATMLDKGFAYANGVSAYAVPLSLVTNRLTGKKIISILQSADMELYNMIRDLSWSTLYRLSTNDTWLDFIDHLNKLLLLYQSSEKRKEKLFSLFQIESSFITQRLIKKLYESAVELLQPEWLKVGTYIIDIANLEDHSDKLLESCLFNKSEYFDVIRQIDEIIFALKTVISGLERKYKNSTILLKDNGYLISLDPDVF